MHEKCAFFTFKSNSTTYVFFKNKITLHFSFGIRVDIRSFFIAFGKIYEYMYWSSMVTMVILGGKHKQKHLLDSDPTVTSQAEKKQSKKG